MATTPPPEEQPTTVQPSASAQHSSSSEPSSSSYTVNVSDIARMPIPGNAELGIWLLALIVAWLVCWIADSLTANDWMTFFLWTTAAYLISRGVAKASRVLEQ